MGGVSIIFIVGKGGIGKTTLAKMVFNETKQYFGKRRCWVCVSERPNLKDLVQQILREVSGENPDCSLSELCTQLRNELSKENFLLVLDDVWELKWWDGGVEGTLMAGAMGSNILITSGKECNDASVIEHTHHLSLLRVDDAEAQKHKASGVGNQLRTILIDDFYSDLPWVYIEDLTNSSG
ncbi:putative disease resistance protein RGA3 [Nymphaea colorata]|uniref:putative disease resistance protein RGA3 n=1 Tax=Nymphaea colorata TaxID=210225 RepID=UPI00129D311A|nr:putative disease resistance protein RGA3 [Nymphaea colorata]